MTDTPTSVYRYYDKIGVLIYVGVTAQRTNRNQQHNQDKEWWPLVSAQEIDHHSSREAALAAEAELIRRFWPPFNTQHNPQAAASKTLYTIFREMGFADEDPLESFRSKGHKIPLDIQQTPGIPISFRTRMEDAAIAMRLVFQPNVRICMSGYSSVGTLGELHRSGPLVRIEVANFRLGVCFDTAEAFLKVIPGKGVPTFGIRHALLTRID